MSNELKNITEDSVLRKDTQEERTRIDADYRKARRAQAAKEATHPFIDWCRHVVGSDGYVIMDTETTSLDGEVIDLAIIDSSGNTLYNSLLKPFGQIAKTAMETHHITEAMVATAPTIAHVWYKICDIIAGKTIITYNAKFDSARIKHSLARYNLTTCDACAALTFECAMLKYAEFWGAPPRFERSSGPAWQSLSTACYQQGITLPPGLHRAMPDCQATLTLLRQVALAGENSPRYVAAKDAKTC